MTMRNIKHKFLHVLLSAMILALLLMPLAGCIYIPTFEQIKNSVSDRDFRPFLSRGHDGLPIQVGMINGSKINNLLGRPAFRSASGKTVAYALETFHGVWLSPLCGVSPGSGTAFVLKLVYDDQDTLKSYDLENAPIGVQNIQMSIFGPRLPEIFQPRYGTGIYDLIDKLNRYPRRAQLRGKPANSEILIEQHATVRYASP